MSSSWSLPLLVLFIVIVLSGSAYEVSHIINTSDQTSTNNHVSVKPVTNKVTTPVVATPSPTTSSPSSTTYTPAHVSISTQPTPTSTQSSINLTKCEAVATDEQSIATGLYNNGVSNRNSDISVIQGYISELPSLEAAYNADPTEGNQQNINNLVATIQNTISYDNTEGSSSIESTNDQIISAYEMYSGDVSSDCPSLTIAPPYQEVPDLPTYTADEPWNP